MELRYHDIYRKNPGSKQMSNKIILETKLVGDIKGKFFVPSYQRGYRWGKDEVIRLLEDIYHNGKKNYCLQPVVVRNNEGYYELIDGQQEGVKNLVSLESKSF